MLSGTKKGSQAFQRQKIEYPNIKADQLLIKSEAFGLNYADVMASMGLYPEAPKRPSVIGYEVIGEVIEVGAELDKNLVGKRIVAFTRFGGYASILAIEKSAFLVVEQEPASDLLSLCTQAVTAYYMTDYFSPIRSNDIVLIHAAAGGVGSLLIQLCKLKGATVLAKVGQQNKEQLVKELGADFIINYKTDPAYEEKIKKFIGHKSLTVSFNPVGGSTFKKDMNLLSFGGRLFLFGGAELTAGKWGILSALGFVFKMGRPLPLSFMMKSQSLLGVNMLKIADKNPEVIAECLAQSYRLYKDSKLKPLPSEVFEITEFHKAFDYLKSGKSTGKVAVRWD